MTPSKKTNEVNTSYFQLSNYELFDDIDKAYENVIQKVMAVIDNLAPSKNKRIKGTSYDWFDAEIMEKMNERDQFFKKFKKSCLHVDEDNYKEARNEVEKLIRTKKKAYFERKRTENIGKLKELRKSVKSLGLKFERSISNINCLENNKSTNLVVRDIAKDFSAHFSNLTEKLVSKFPIPLNKYSVLLVAQYYSHLGLTKNFDLLPTEKENVLKILRDIDTSEAASINRLPGRFLKNGANVLAKPVTDTCNLSISLNKFPSAFKLAKVKPIFKRGRKTNVSNYRPISLLPMLSKVIEKVVHEQTSKFLNDNIFYKYQSGFRCNHSTDLFLSFLNNRISKGFDNGMYTSMVLIDLQKAFDTINHKILLDKLFPIDFSSNTIS